MDSKEYFKGMMTDQNDFTKLKLFNCVRDLFVETCKKFSNQTAIVWNNGSVSYNELLKDSLKLSYQLKDTFCKGDNIGLFFSNEYDFVKSFFACSILGLVCAIIPSSVSNEKLKGLIHLFDLKGVLCNKEVFVSNSIVVNVQNISYGQNCWDIEEAISKAKIDKNDPSCIVFTGGTTGFPKGALLSQINLCRGALNGALVEGKVFNIKYLSLIPFSHIFGLIKNLLSCILTGSELYIVSNPALFAKEAAQYQPETLVLTPGLCNIVLTLMNTYGDKIFGGNFKTIIAGGANVPAKLINKFLEKGIRCLPGYGLTEATNLVSGNASINEKPSSVGVPYPEQELKIVDGELWIKGDNVFIGYYKNQEANKKCFEDGFLKTGDLASFDDEGYLYIHGRVNNLIVLQSGLKVCPEDIENLIVANELIKDCIVKKEQNNDLLVAEVLLFENNDDNMKRVETFIKNQVNSKLDSASLISKIIFRNEDFKRTPAMKIIRS
jgi:long-chain acyl-CoA synthetase